MTQQSGKGTSHAESETELAELIRESGSNTRSLTLARLFVGLFVATVLMVGASLAMSDQVHQTTSVSPWSGADTDSKPLRLSEAKIDDTDSAAVGPCNSRRLVSDSKELFEDPCIVPIGDMLDLEQGPPKCSGLFDNCKSTQCCSLPGAQCYAKSEHFAMCLESCNPGPQPFDVGGMEWWSCEELGKRSAGEPLQCAEESENCAKSKCCKDAGMACFEKNRTFGSCRNTCAPGPQYTDEDWEPWTCTKLGQHRPSRAEWVDEHCAGDYADCRNQSCCKTSGFQCYEKDDFYAQCRAECNTDWLPGALVRDPSMDAKTWLENWTCRELGGRTPTHAVPNSGKASPWVGHHCSVGEEDCRETRCCRSIGMRCYEKHPQQATCRKTCEAGLDVNNETWSCKELGPRLEGVSFQGFPSLLCFSVLQVDTYELAVVREQYDKSTGIFDCDDTVLFSDKPLEIGGNKALQTPNITVGTTIDQTAGNTELFMAIWDLLLKDGRVWHHHWTVKVDPDAVMFPDRLRIRLAPRTESDTRVFVVNCNAWPSADRYPMMYGAVEIFSLGALQAYAGGVDRCKDELPWQDWSEDCFLTSCMEMVGVGNLADFNLLGDQICVGPGQYFGGDCNDPKKVGFHPFKTIESWTECWRNATNTTTVTNTTKKTTATNATNASSTTKKTKKTNASNTTTVTNTTTATKATNASSTTKKTKKTNASNTTIVTKKTNTTTATNTTNASNTIKKTNMTTATNTTNASNTIKKNKKTKR